MALVTFSYAGGETAVDVPAGTTLLQAAIRAKLTPDAPCGGRGTCGKCTAILDGRAVLACQTPVTEDCRAVLPQRGADVILESTLDASCTADGTDDYVLAFDVGTTTVAGFLLDGKTGAQLASASALNPQTAYGADVISRIRYALQSGQQELQDCIRQTLSRLAQQMTRSAGICPERITRGCLVGNTAMHHLLLGIDPKPLATPPYMPNVREAMEVPFGEHCRMRVLPNIAGFVGADTTACLSALEFDRLEPVSLLIDIGTNGEMVLGNRHRRIACSTAAGPALEGAGISCGMRGAAGAVDRVLPENGGVRLHVIGGGEAEGLCGSGLLDLTAALLELGLLDSSGRLRGRSYRLPGTEVTLTQKDVRQVQLAKAAIRVGIELLAEKLGVPLSQIETVYLAGAFGSCLDPASACRIGLLPPELLPKIRAVGNAAGAGAKRCALSAAAFETAKTLAAETEFLELASSPGFQERYIGALDFE